ncbi:MAG: AAA family ATPase [Planctomycetota bacterium]|jgi:predicted ATP-binding protein involved in virulence
MRVDRLWLRDFKNLKDFEVDFDETSTRQVVIGRNGVGKSNLLEALTCIFRDLDLEQPSDFAYEIEYVCNNHYVKIVSEQTNEADCSSDPAVKPLFKRTYGILEKNTNDSLFQDQKLYKNIREVEFYRRNRSSQNGPNPKRLIPLYVFGYYSGITTRFHKIFERHEERYYKEQITGKEAPLRSLFLAKPHHSQFALLAFFASQDEPAQRFLKKEFHICGLESVLFALREPYWKQSNPSKEKKASGDPRFWYAGGKVAPFLNSLFEYSLAPMTGKKRVRISLGREKNMEWRFCFIPTLERLQALAKGLSSKEFFARLESAIFSDLISTSGEDLRIRIKLTTTKKPVTFSELAEGERQLLTVLGLLRFTAENEALFLLDEPDTHLNPAWCLDYLDNLHKYGAEPPNSQIIMTTHSPLTFAGLDKNEVVLLEQDHEGHIYAEHPVNAPKGMGFAAMLTSDFFGLRSTLDKETLEKIDKKRRLALKQNKTDKDRKELASLNEELGKLDFSKAARDPLYLEYIRAISAAQKDNASLGQAVPPKDIWRKRKEIAKDIAQRLLRNKGIK